MIPLDSTATVTALTTAIFIATGTALAAQGRDEGRGYIALGLGAAQEPVFSGSDRSQIDPDPIIEARLGRFFVGELGVGADIFVSDGPSELTFGAAIGLGEGRKERDDRRLNGMGDLGNAVELALFAEAGLGPFDLDAAIVKDVGSGHGGTYLKLGIGFENAVSDRLTYEVELTAIYGDATYANAFYGVSSAQAAGSGYAAFAPGAGFTEASLDLSLRYALTDAWFAEASLGVGTLLGDARNAPFAARDRFTSATIGIGRVFRF